MKAVLISIQPKWCELIASGKKTVEVRKTKPNLETPFKVYIYCAANKQGVNDLLEIHSTDGKFRKANSKVIGEFVCDEITTAKLGNYCNISLTDACLDAYELMDYADDKPLYGWHISNLVIYDKPKELKKFHKPCVVNPCVNRNFCSTGNTFCPTCTIQKPPQSWCYVERLGEG